MIMVSDSCSQRNRFSVKVYLAFFVPAMNEVFWQVCVRSGLVSAAFDYFWKAWNIEHPCLRQFVRDSHVHFADCLF